MFLLSNCRMSRERKKRRLNATMSAIELSLKTHLKEVQHMIIAVSIRIKHFSFSQYDALAKIDVDEMFPAASVSAENKKEKQKSVLNESFRFIWVIGSVLLRLAKSKVAISYTYEDSTVSGPSRPAKLSKFAKHERERSMRVAMMNMVSEYGMCAEILICVYSLRQKWTLMLTEWIKRRGENTPVTHAISFVSHIHLSILYCTVLSYFSCLFVCGFVFVSL